MIHRLTRGVVPDKPHTAFSVDGELAFEHCFTRSGFEGAFTIIYHRRPPHWTEGEEDLGSHPGLAEASWQGPLRRCHFLSDQVPTGGSPFLARRLLVADPDVGVWVGPPACVPRMVDTFKPLLPTAHAPDIEDRGYNSSWVAGPGTGEQS